MLNGVSDTAKYGGLTVGPKVIDEDVKDKMRQAALRVKSGEFAKEWLEEYSKGAPTLERLMEAVKNYPIEQVGTQMRKLLFGP